MSKVVLRDGYPFVPYQPEPLDDDVALARGQALFTHLDARRSVRFFSDKPVPKAMIEAAIQTASTAPSGAHQQPWTFVAISDPVLKRRIREAAEEEERKSYDGRMSEEWREALAPLGTDANKSYLETVPWIVVVFAQTTGTFPNGRKRKHYYVKESVGLACGLFIASLHRMGLSTLTHTPSPMGFLSALLNRPANEKPYILFPVGHASEDAVVPSIERRSLQSVSVWFEASAVDSTE
ncbi:MAG: nitroreductase family protein [Rhodobacterales bacterium]|nr:nitroreductase family protein [Rhodobacterales bacterium]